MRSTAALASLLLTTLASCTAAAPRVAVFSDLDFPYYSGVAALTPDRVVEACEEHGLNAAELTAGQLADPDVFNAEEFAIYVHVYGNTFPVEAFDNLKAFHRAGGCIFSTGVPFCHPCRPRGAAGWSPAPDPETGEQYTVKRYESEKVEADDGTWRHVRVTLRPRNPEFVRACPSIAGPR